MGAPETSVTVPVTLLTVSLSPAPFTTIESQKASPPAPDDVLAIPLWELLAPDPAPPAPPLPVAPFPEVPVVAEFESEEHPANSETNATATENASLFMMKRASGCGSKDAA